MQSSKVSIKDNDNDFIFYSLQHYDELGVKEKEVIVPVIVEK